MNAAEEDPLIDADTDSSDTGMNFDAQVVTEHRLHHLLDLMCQFSGGSKQQGLAFHQAIVNLLQKSRTEGGSLPRP